MTGAFDLFDQRYGDDPNSGTYSGVTDLTCVEQETATTTRGVVHLSLRFSGSFAVTQGSQCPNGVVNLTGTASGYDANGEPVSVEADMGMGMHLDTTKGDGWLTVAEQPSTPLDVTYSDTGCNDPASARIQGNFVLPSSALDNASPDQAQSALQSSHPDVIATSTAMTSGDQATWDSDEDPDTTKLQPILGGDANSGYVSGGTAVDSAISGNYAEGFTFAPGGDPALQLIPVDGAAATGAWSPKLVNDSAALFPNTALATDTVLRPGPNGVSAYVQIRNGDAPEDFSWAVTPSTMTDLLPDTVQALLQGVPSLQQIDANTVAVLQTPVVAPDPGADLLTEDNATSAAQGDGGAAGGPANDTAAQYDEADAADEVAQQNTGGTTIAVITAPKATDAQGSSVPVSLSVKGNIVTMHVSHKAQGRPYPIVAAAKSSSRPPSCKKALTWGNPATEFAVPFNEGKGYGIPQCRKMAPTGYDFKPSAAINEGYLANSNLSTSGDTSLGDSFVDKIGVVRWNATAATWDLYDAAGTTKLGSFSQVKVQGHGCQDTKSHAASHYIVGFKTPGQPGGIRAFVLKSRFSGLPSKISRASTGCGKKKGHAASTHALTDPGLDGTEPYLGHTLDPQNSKEPKVGGYYGTYDVHSLGANKVIYLSASSTAVAGGGIVEAVLPVSGPAFSKTDAVRVYDTFGYSDPNVKCGADKQARWQYVQIRHGTRYQRMYGFIPTRSSSGSRAC